MAKLGLVQLRLKTKTEKMENNENVHYVRSLAVTSRLQAIMHRWRGLQRITSGGSQKNMLLTNEGGQIEHDDQFVLTANSLALKSLCNNPVNDI